MDNPFPLGDPRAADTFDWGGILVQAATRFAFPRAARILDVGPGFGKYRFLLPDYPMDACEVWEPTVEKENLTRIYDIVYIQDICDFVESPEWHPYSLVIMGDVFEHIEREKAKAVVTRILDTCGDLYVITPYLHPQGIEDSNPYQIHIQDDLTPEMMEQEFPQLELVKTEYRNSKPYKGFYARRR